MTHSKNCSKKGGSSNCKAKFGAYSSRDGPDTCSKLHHRSPYNQNFRVRSFGVLPNESSMTHFHIFKQNLSKLLKFQTFSDFLRLDISTEKRRKIVTNRRKNKFTHHNLIGL